MEYTYRWLDTLGDTCTALNDFEEKGFGVELGKKYISQYETFQAIVLQQVAISYLYKLLVGKRLSIQKIPLGQDLEK
jgi:hypothetical protein